MSFNILDAAKALFTTQLVNKVAGNLGESESTLNNAFGAIIPALLGGLATKSETPGGAGSILNMIQTVATQYGDRQPEVIAEDPSLLSSGWEMVKGLFGSQSDNLLSKLVSHSGSKVSSITSLLGLAAPMILRMLGRHVSTNGLTSSGLASLFADNKNSIMSAIPGGLGLGSIFSNAFSAQGHDAPHRADHETERVTTYEEPKNDGGNKWLLPLLLVVALGALLWWFFNRNKPAETDTVTVTDTADTATPSATYADPATLGTYDSTSGNFIYNRGNDVQLQFGDKTLTVGENSAEARLYRFLTDSGVSVNEADKTQGWITLDRVYFETGRNVLTAASQEQLRNIADLMKAYPNSTVKFGGYTDNTGSDDVNMPLSANRAKAAMDAVAALGIDAARMASEGYGSQHAIADNATAEGRALNRRVDVRVTAK